MNGLWDLIYTKPRSTQILIKLSEEPESGISIFKDHTIFSTIVQQFLSHILDSKKNADEETDIKEAINEPVLDTILKVRI